MRRRTFQTSDSPTVTLTLQLIETNSSILGGVVLRWSSLGVGMEIPPGSLKYIGSFQDVLDLIVRYPHSTRDEVVARLSRYGYTLEQ